MRWNAWNLLLLLPLFALFTPVFNRIEPRLFGVPFFYWFQLVSILVGMLLTVLVYAVTKGDQDYVVTDRPDRIDVDSLDEGVFR